MKKFEQQLLEAGSLELICSYVEEHKETSSKEFKEALVEKIKGILQAFGIELFCSDGVPTISQAKAEILAMDVKDFLDKYYRGRKNFPQSFYEQCQEKNIKTANDLLELGYYKTLKMKKVGTATCRMINDAFEEVGINFF